MDLASQKKYQVFYTTSRANRFFNFTSSHNGMGKFLLVPEKQDVFYAVWKDEKGIEHRTDLPAVHSSGVALRILSLKEKLVFSVARPAESQANQQVVIIAI
ncbi:MAG: hypothetical protein WDM78_10860 [Puia sp.]